MTAPVNNPVGTLTEYELRHLVAHLAAAGRDEDVHRLLALETGEGRNAWYKAREVAGDIEGYLVDVTLAWQMAGTKRDIPTQIKYALCQSSIVGMAANYPPDLPALAVKYQYFTPRQALGIVRSMTGEEKRFETLFNLVPHLSGTWRQEALKEAMFTIKVMIERAPSFSVQEYPVMTLEDPVAVFIKLIPLLPKELLYPFTGQGRWQERGDLKCRPAPHG
jgi:hypothetical protein